MPGPGKRTLLLNKILHRTPLCETEKKLKLLLKKKNKTIMIDSLQYFVKEFNDLHSDVI